MTSSVLHSPRPEESAPPQVAPQELHAPSVTGDATPRVPELPLDPGVKLVGGLRDAVRAHSARRYSVDGLSLREIATEIGRSYGLAHRLITESGVAKHPAGGQPRH